MRGGAQSGAPPRGRPPAGGVRKKLVEMGQAERDKPLYMISVAAELTGMHPQTLRVYESKGLVNPKRSGGNTRLYSRADIERLELINQLTDEGINLAGVVRILDMKERAEKREAEIDRLQTRVRELEDQVAEYKVQKKITALVPRGGSADPRAGAPRPSGRRDLAADAPLAIRDPRSPPSRVATMAGYFCQTGLPSGEADDIDQHPGAGAAPVKGGAGLFLIEGVHAGGAIAPTPFEDGKGAFEPRHAALPQGRAHRARLGTAALGERRIAPALYAMLRVEQGLAVAGEIQGLHGGPFARVAPPRPSGATVFGRGARGVRRLRPGSIGGAGGGRGACAAFYSVTGSPGSGASTRSGLTTACARTRGSPLNVDQSGASTVPQWMQRRRALG